LIVKTLMKQFSLDVTSITLGGRPRSPVEQRHANRFKSDVWRDLGLFYRLNPAKRFSINVLVEAILSTWAASPLPGDAGAHRYTQNLVRAIGWEAGFPGTTMDLSPINSLIKRVHTEHAAKQGNSRVSAAPYPKRHTVSVDQVDQRETRTMGQQDAPTVDRQEAHRVRMEKMIRFYRRWHSIDALMSQVARNSRREKNREIKAGRDLREKDNNQED
jgi:hypothetical protein